MEFTSALKKNSSLSQRLAAMQAPPTPFVSDEAQGIPKPTLYGEKWEQEPKPKLSEAKEVFDDSRTILTINEGRSALSANPTENVMTPRGELVRRHPDTWTEVVEVAGDSKGRVRLTIYDEHTGEVASREFMPGEMFSSIDSAGNGQTHVLTAVGGDVTLRVHAVKVTLNKERRS